MADSLLIELLTEELPPKSLARLSEAFHRNLVAGLRKEGFLAGEARTRAFATPRRLAVWVEQVLDRQPDRLVERKGPAVAAGFDAAGNLTPALAGFARSCGVEVDGLGRERDAKGEYFVFRTQKPGEPLHDHLARLVEAALKALPVQKLMRWGEREVEFVRPVHGLVMLHGRRLVPGTVLGVASRATTCGHRFLTAGPIPIPHGDQYEQILQAQGRVLADFQARREEIERRLVAAAHPSALDDPADLITEVTALVEYPAIYEGRFSPDFLSVPQECLSLSMKSHQKYFPLKDAAGRLEPRFLMVSNLPTDQPAEIIHGNERVLRARLSDAKFFFDQDRKQPLEARVERLGDVVYHNKLGTQLERVRRIAKLAGEIALALGADAEAASRAAWLCKADLLTDMVGEFPELQGVMGAYYARHDGEPETVARAIEGHYHPRFAGDTLPADDVSASLALADKLDTLVGIFGVGLVPTGDRDPFALRRHALGVLRILVETPLPLDLVQWLTAASAQFADQTLNDGVVVDLHDFILERLRYWLREQGFEPDEVEAVVAQRPTRVDRVGARLQAVRSFKGLPEAQALAAAHKRIHNILKKAPPPVGQPDVALLEAGAERALFDTVNTLSPRVRSLVENEDYEGALKALAGVRAQVDAFFEDVLVMADDEAVRHNRLALLAWLGELMNQVADLSRLAV
ncbi:MAG: glycine--tRNA ligase subunit beta [Betaproteobacteria bacterium]|nr:glycine--tRNA ligase subunit beta [Betaproteobacteria bacterium]